MKYLFQLFPVAALLTLALLTPTDGLRAQNFPVRASVTIVNPSPYLEDYGRDGNVLVILTLVDDRPTYEGLLRISIAGNGYEARTNEGQFLQPIRLRRGQPLILRGQRLAPYFNLNNLDVSGALLGDTYENGGALPDGPVTITAEFFDINRFADAPVSNTAMATRFIQQNNPPQLVMPFGAQLTEQVVNFTWNPRHSVQVANDVYFLEVWEKVPGLTYDQIALSRPPVRRPIETMVPRYVFTNYDARLEEGKSYIYRVRVADRRRIRRFINGGYSEFGEFSIGNVPGGENESTTICAEVTGLLVDQLTATTGSVGWAVQNPEGLQELSGRYRVVGGRDWLPLDLASTVNGRLPLANLLGQTEYEVELRADCSDGSQRTASTRFTTPLDQNECGPLPSPVTMPVSATTLQLDWPGNPRATGYKIRWTPIRSTAPVTGTTSIGDATNNTNNNQRNVRGAVGDFGDGDGTSDRTPRSNTPNRGAGDGDGPSRGRGTTVGDGAARQPRADSLTVQAPTTTATLTSLVVGTVYSLEFCQYCPDGSLECRTTELDFQGVRDECVQSVTVSYADSTDTTLDLFWNFTQLLTAPSDSFDLIWQVSDESYAADTARVAYRDGAYTITDRLPGRAYTLKLCAECLTGQPACRDLPDFGGCAAEYQPEIVDVEAVRLLLGYATDQDSARAAEMRFRRKIFQNNRVLNPGISYFTAADYYIPTAQLRETPTLTRGITYQFDLRTQCADSIYSEWSAPIEFNLICTLDDSLTLAELTDTTALITGFAVTNAQYYQFSYRRVGQGSWSTWNNSARPEFPMLNLERDTEYEVKLRYWCTAGVWSNSTSVLRFRTHPFCGRPTNVRTSEITDRSFAVAFDLGANAVATLIDYREYIAPTGGGELDGNYNPGYIGQWQQVTVVGDSALLQPLAPGSNYQFKLSSRCALNESYPTPQLEVALACQPALVAAEAVDSTTGEFYMLSNNAFFGQNYFEYRRLGDTTWLNSRNLPGTTVLQPYLEDLTTYEVRGRATCADESLSPYSPIAQFTTPVDCRVPTELGVTRLTHNEMELRWDVTGTVRQWEVSVFERSIGNTQAAQSLNQLMTAGGGGGAPPTNPAPAASPPPDPQAMYTRSPWKRYRTTTPSLLLNGLSPAMEYRIVVRASCPTYGYTDFSEELEVRTLCAPVGPDGLDAPIDQLWLTKARLEWTPRPACAFAYQVHIQELAPMQNTSIDPFDEFAGPSRGTAGTVSAPILLDRTYYTANTYFIPINLKPNTQYRFRVQAMYQEGTFDPAPFPYRSMTHTGGDFGELVKGQPGLGQYSGWLPFRTEECAVPTGIEVLQLSGSSVQISWDENRLPNNYTVRYRPTIDGNAVTEITSGQSPVVLDNITRNQDYEFTITENCVTPLENRSSAPDTFFISRVSRNNGLYACGLDAPVDLSRQTPLTSLSRGDTVRAYDFDIAITKASGGNGIWSGEGKVELPYFNAAKVTFKFDTVFINDQNRMVNGYMLVTGFGIEVLPPWADSLLATAMAGLQELDNHLQGQQVAQLDSLLQCCVEYMPPHLQDELQAVVDCYNNNPDPQAAGCQTLLDTLMTHVNASLDSVSQGMDTMIVEAFTMEIIRSAAEELEADFIQARNDSLTAYNAAMTQYGQLYQTIPPAPGRPNYLQQATALPPNPTRSSAGGGAMSDYSSQTVRLRQLGANLTEQDMLATHNPKLDRVSTLRSFVQSLRSGDTDVFTPIHTAVRTAWYDTNNPGQPDKPALINQAKALLITKMDFLAHQ